MGISVGSFPNPEPSTFNHFAGVHDSLNAPDAAIVKQLGKWEKETIRTAVRGPLQLQRMQLGTNLAQCSGMMNVMMEPKGAGATLRVTCNIPMQTIADRIRKGAASTLGATFIELFLGRGAPAFPTTPSSDQPDSIAKSLLQLCGVEGDPDTRTAIMSLIGTLHPPPSLRGCITTRLPVPSHFCWNSLPATI